MRVLCKQWIADCVAHLRDGGFCAIEPNREAEDAWVTHVDEVADGSLRLACNNWYLGANVPGKPRVFLPYLGGFPRYVAKCDEVARNGYQGFTLSRSRQTAEAAEV